MADRAAKPRPIETGAGGTDGSGRQRPAGRASRPARPPPRPMTAATATNFQISNLPYDVLVKAVERTDLAEALDGAA